VEKVAWDEKSNGAAGRLDVSFAARRLRFERTCRGLKWSGLEGREAGWFGNCDESSHCGRLQGQRKEKCPSGAESLLRKNNGQPALPPVHPRIFIEHRIFSNRRLLHAERTSVTDSKPQNRDPVCLSPWVPWLRAQHHICTCGTGAHVRPPRYCLDLVVPPVTQHVRERTLSCESPDTPASNLTDMYHTFLATVRSQSGRQHRQSSLSHLR
jgi:hypothetical protein